MVAPVGDIILDGIPFRIDMGSWKVRDLTDFAPRAASPGGSIIHSELGLYQPQLQTDWRHGFGFQWYEDASGYMKTTGQVDTRQAGLAMLFTSASASDLTTSGQKETFVSWNDYVWSPSSTGLHQLTSGSVWSQFESGSAINCVLPTKDYLFYCRNGSRIRKINTSGSATDTGVNTSAADYKWLIIHGGYIYAGVDGSNRVHKSSTEDLSDLEGDTTDPAKILVGGGGLATIGAITYASKLYVSRSDGLWNIGDDDIARKVLDFSNELSSDNFRSMAVFNGYLIFSVRDKLYQWNGSRMQEQTPPKLTDTYPYVTYGRFDNFVVVEGYFYCTARTNESSWTESLLCWDGTGWTRLCDLVSADNTQTVTGMGYDTTYNRLWYHVTDTAPSDATYYIPFNPLSPFPYALFPTSGSNYLYSSRWDMGFRFVDKSIPAMWVEASNTSGSSRYLTVDYCLDNGSWVTWNTVREDGITKLTYPGGNHTVEFKHFQWRVGFVTNSTTQTPVLEGITLRFLMRPETFYGFGFTVVAAQNYQYGMYEDNRSPAAILKQLRTIRDKKMPVQFQDIHGDAYWVYISSFSEAGQERFSEENGSVDNIEHVCAINLTEADF